jgi:hypothetical protein
MDDNEFKDEVVRLLREINGKLENIEGTVGTIWTDVMDVSSIRRLVDEINEKLSGADYGCFQPRCAKTSYAPRPARDHRPRIRGRSSGLVAPSADA